MPMSAVIICYLLAYALIGVAVVTVTCYLGDDKDMDDFAASAMVWPFVLVVLLTTCIIMAPTAIRRARGNHGERKFQRDLERERRKTALAAERAEQARLEAQALHSWMPPQ
jgi:hypothetical protein